MTFIGEVLSTPYGRGKVISIENNSIVLIPTNWRLAKGQKPIFHLNPNDVKEIFLEGTKVNTQYGPGHITSIRAQDAVYIVILDSWHLATGKSPILYLQGETLELSPVTVVEEVVVETPAPVVVQEETPAPVAVEETPAPVQEEAPVVVEEVVVEEAPAPVVVEETPAPVQEEVVETPAPVVEEVVAPAPVVVEEAPPAPVVVEEVVVEEAPAPVVVEETPAPVQEEVVVETPAPVQEEVVVETPAPVVEEVAPPAPVVVEEVSSSFHVGDKVVSMYGKGTVREIRSATSIVIEPSTWLLANNKPPVFYLNSESIMLESEVNSAKESAQAQVAVENSSSAPASTEPAKKKGCIVS